MPRVRRLLDVGLWILLAGLLPAVAAHAAGGARIDGVLVGDDGRPAAGYGVQLIDAGGAVVGEARTADDGAYGFRGLAPDAYSLGVRHPEGMAAPVLSAAVQLDAGEAARVDVRLKRADARLRENATGGNYGLGLWWAGLSTSAKVWTVVGVLTVTGITVAALDDDDEETPPSCGNGRLDLGEQCDDGNVTAGDGCSPTCEFEASPFVVGP